MSLKFLIIGAGYIGNYLSTHLPNAKLFIGYIHNTETLKYLLEKEAPGHIIINCIGKTGRPNIDWCEDHKDQVFGVNVGLPIMLAEACKKLGNYWMHIGSGCIYDGYEQEFTEEDLPNFKGSFYSRTKYWSQEILMEFDEVAILRIRMPIDEHLEERCYISKVVDYAKKGYNLFNLPNSMTVLSDLVEAIKFIAEKGLTGNINVTNQGAMTIGQILELYKKYVEPELNWKISRYEDIVKNLKAERSNCVLVPSRLEREGFMMPFLYDKVEEIIKNYKK